MATKDYFATICTAGTPGVYLYSVDIDTGAITQEASIANGSFVFSYVARTIAKDPDGSYYVAGDYTTPNPDVVRVYKLTSALAIDTSWGTSGYVDLAADSGTQMDISVNADKKILVVCNDTDLNDSVFYLDSDGTELWKGTSYDNAGNPGVTICVDGAFLPDGDVLAAQSQTALAGLVCRIDSSAGDFVDTYAAQLSVADVRVHYAKSGYVYIHYRATGGDPQTILSKYATESYNTADYDESSLDILPTRGFFEDNGNLYLGGTRSSGSGPGYVHKVSASDGSTVVARYEYDTAGASDGVEGVCKTDNGKIVYTVNSKTGASGGPYDIIVLNDDMTFLGGYNDANTYAEAVGAGSEILTTTTPTDLLYSRNLVAFAGDSVFYEDSAGSMTQITETGGGIGQAAADAFDMSESLTAAEAYQKIFVANNTTLAVVDFVNTRISSSVAFTNVSLAQHGTLLYQNNGGDPATIVVDTVLGTSVANKTMLANVVSGTLSTATDITTASGGGGSTVVSGATTISLVNSVPVIYNHTPCAHPTAGTNGAMPEKATLVCRYRGRVVYAGNPDYPFQWYMARQADPFDWLYAVNDAQAPVAGGNADAGEIGDVIQALIPRGDDYLIFGCSNTIWLMRGDPAAGGSLDELTATTGIYGPRSWCFDDAGFLYFWGRNGVYRMPPNFGGVENLTSIVLPNIVSDEAPEKNTHRIVFAYDRVRQLVCIYITKMSDGTNSNYVYDIRTQGFFPESYPDELAIFSAYFYDAIDADYQKLYLGSRDSLIRNYDDSKKDDAGFQGNEAINSYATIGPAQIGPDIDQRGRMKTMSITTGTDTDGVSYDIHVADTAEEVVDDIAASTTPLHTGTISSGNRVQQLRPRARGAWMGIKLVNSTLTESWQFEKLIADFKPAGDIK
jgi:hypothetical protein